MGTKLNYLAIAFDVNQTQQNNVNDFKPLVTVYNCFTLYKQTLIFIYAIIITVA